MAVVTPVIVLPGSGCTPTRECNFYSWFGDAIEKTGRYKAVMQNMVRRGALLHWKSVVR